MRLMRIQVVQIRDYNHTTQCVCVCAHACMRFISFLYLISCYIMASHRVFFRSTNQMLAVLHAYVIYLMYVMKLTDFLGGTFPETHFQLFQPQPLNPLQNNLTWRESEDIVSALRPKGLRLRDAISAAHTANCSESSRGLNGEACATYSKMLDIVLANVRRSKQPPFCSYSV